MRVLLVEDDALMRKMISKTISSRFPEIVFTECQSVPEAKAAYDAGERYDFALVDFELIGGTGYDVVSYIRGERGDKLLPIMMCTSHQDRKTVLKMLELGINDYLAKPFQPKKIIDKVERLVERSNRIREAIERRKQTAPSGDASPPPATAPGDVATATPSADAPATGVAATAAPPKPPPAADGPSPPAAEKEGKKKGSVHHGALGEGIIDDSEEGKVEYIDLKGGKDDDAHVEVSEDMFL